MEPETNQQRGLDDQRKPKFGFASVRGNDEDLPGDMYGANRNCNSKALPTRRMIWWDQLTPEFVSRLLVNTSKNTRSK
jgi:hypothetical protein